MQHKIESRTGPRGIILILDSRQIFPPDDPGQGTPAMVEYQGETATYWSVFDTGCCGDTELPDSVFEWIEKQIGLVDDFYCEYTQE